MLLDCKAWRFPYLATRYQKNLIFCFNIHQSKGINRFFCILNQQKKCKTVPKKIIVFVFSSNCMSDFFEFIRIFHFGQFFIDSSASYKHLQNRAKVKEVLFFYGGKKSHIPSFTLGPTQNCCQLWQSITSFLLTLLVNIRN